MLIGVVAPTMEDRVDVVLVQKDLCVWVACTQITDLRPVPLLCCRVVCDEHVCGVALVHLVVEGPGVGVPMYAYGGIHHDVTLVLAKDEPDGRQEETID